MSNGSFRRALVDLDRELASVPFTGERDVRTVVAARRTPWRLPVLALGVAVALVLIVRARGDQAAPQVPGFEIAASEESWQVRDSVVEVLAPTLEVEVPGFGRVVATRGARVARIDGGIHVVRGHVDVDVTHRVPGLAPAVVRVSHGAIAVLGTRFTIDQDERGGRVVLHEGRIRFDAGERTVVLEPGASLTWPLSSIASEPPVAPVQPASIAPPAHAERHADVQPPRHAGTPARLEPAPVESTPEPVTPPAEVVQPAPDGDRVITELANLRARRRFADAAALLERTLAGELPAASRERLSYELGDILTYQLATPQRACRHWHEHRARFAKGRYTDEIEAAVRRLGCEDTKP